MSRTTHAYGGGVHEIRCTQEEQHGRNRTSPPNQGRRKPSITVEEGPYSSIREAMCLVFKPVPGLRVQDAQFLLEQLTAAGGQCLGDRVGRPVHLERCE